MNKLDKVVDKSVYCYRTIFVEISSEPGRIGGNDVNKFKKHFPSESELIWLVGAPRLSIWNRTGKFKMNPGSLVHYGNVRFTIV